MHALFLRSMVGLCMYTSSELVSELATCMHAKDVYNKSNACVAKHVHTGKGFISIARRAFYLPILN